MKKNGQKWPLFSRGHNSVLRFRNWMNSQGLSPKIRKLYYDIEDGCNILYVMDKVKPGCVDHKRINKPPYKALAALPKKIENCNYAIDLGKKLNFSLVGVAGNDILDHNPTLTLALLWQMMRAYTVKVCMSHIQYESYLIFC